MALVVYSVQLQGWDQVPMAKHFRLPFDGGSRALLCLCSLQNLRLLCFAEPGMGPHLAERDGVLIGEQVPSSHILPRDMSTMRCGVSTVSPSHRSSTLPFGPFSASLSRSRVREVREVGVTVGIVVRDCELDLTLGFQGLCAVNAQCSGLSLAALR